MSGTESSRCDAKNALPRCHLCLEFRVRSVMDVLRGCVAGPVCVCMCVCFFVYLDPHVYELLTLSPAGSSSVAAWMA